MKKQLKRLGVAACSAVALMAIPAAGAQAAPVVATTGTGITGGPTGEYLTGAVNTAGGRSIWQFEYGTTSAYGQKTPVVNIAAGNGLVIVYFPVRNLKPNTTYHFRLDAQDQAFSSKYGYYYLSGVGSDATFTTASAGTIKLLSTKLKVKKGKARFRLKCNSTVGCQGKYSATAKHKVKGKTKRVSCFSGNFSLKAGATGTSTAKVSKKCLKLFKHKKLRVTLTVTPTTVQPKLSKKVTLRR